MQFVEPASRFLESPPFVPLLVRQHHPNSDSSRNRSQSVGPASPLLEPPPVVFVPLLPHPNSVCLDFDSRSQLVGPASLFFEPPPVVFVRPVYFVLLFSSYVVSIVQTVRNKHLYPLFFSQDCCITSEEIFIVLNFV